MDKHNDSGDHTHVIKVDLYNIFNSLTEKSTLLVELVVFLIICIYSNDFISFRDSILEEGSIIVIFAGWDLNIRRCCYITLKGDRFKISLAVSCHTCVRSEHITRARRRGVCDLYLKPAHKTYEKTNANQRKSGERINHKSTTHSRTNSHISHKSSSKSSSGTSHRSRSPLRIRLSDYYEVSSVGHCDMSGVRLKTIHNGALQSKGIRGGVINKKRKNFG